MNTTTVCVQCGDALGIYPGRPGADLQRDQWSAYFCENPECPNYALLQVGITKSEEKKS